MADELDNVFDQEFNVWTGKLNYDFQPEERDTHQATARSSFGDMLHDWDRNQKYERALKSAIEEMHQKGKQANVLDVGMGTGLLSMMAVRNGADSVTSCECFKAIYDCALKVIERNGFKDKIKAIFKSSHLLTVGPGCDLEKRANILVAELFDTELIGENALYFFKHAIENLLEEDCIVIPQYAKIYAQVVECSIAQDWHKIWDVYNDDDGKLLLKVPTEVKRCPGPNMVHDLQLSQLKQKSFNTIIPPVCAYMFDFTGKTPVELKNFKSTTVEANRSGNAQVIFMWWELQMDTKAEVILSCAPSWAHPEKDNYPWRDHWMQSIYYIPQETQLKEGQHIQLVCAQDGLSFMFKLMDLDEDACLHNFREFPHCYCELHSMSRTKVGQMNWAMKSKKYLPILKKYISKDSTILMLSEGYFLGLVAAMLGARKVYCIGGDFCNRTSETFSQFTRLNGIDNVELFKNFDHLQNTCELENIDVIFGEPYFVESVLPWDNLRFTYLIKSMKHRLKSDIKILPQSATIKCIAVNFVDLHKIRVPVNECEGLSMEDFEELIAHSSSVSDEVIEPQPLWEYPGFAVSATQEIVTIDLLDNPLDVIEKKGVLELNESCNGIAFWIDWKHENDSSRVMSTGPTIEPKIGELVQWNMHYKQGVCLFPTKNISSLNYEFRFDFNNGNVSFDYDMTI